MSIKISELPTITSNELSNDDVVPIVDLNPGGTPRTKKASLTDLFTRAPVKSINGITTGDVSLASTNLTDASTIGRILNINGYSLGNVSLGSGDLTNSANIALHTKLGSVSQFTSEYNNPTTGQLQTEYQELARLLGNDVKDVRVSLFAVQQTADNALPSSTASSLYATKSSLGNYVTQTSLSNNYYDKTDSDNKFATQVSLSNDYSKSTEIASIYATQQYVQNQIGASSGSSVSIFNVVGMDATGNVSIGGDLAVTNNLSIGSHITCEDLTASDMLKGLRAEIGDGTANTNRLTIKGDADIQGKLTCDNIEVQGQMQVHSSQVVQIQDDFIELNRKTDGTPQGTIAGLLVETGVTNKAQFSWDNTASIWQTKMGSGLADLRANVVEFKNTFSAISALPSASTNRGMFAEEQGNKQAIYSNGTKWVSLIDSDQLGTTTQFDTAFANALS